MTGTGKSCRRQASEHASRAKKFEAWPVSEASLDTLMDLGMTDDQIARYFKTTAEDVEKLTSGKRRRARGHVGGPVFGLRQTAARPARSYGAMKTGDGSRSSATSLSWGSNRPCVPHFVG